MLLPNIEELIATIEKPEFIQSTYIARDHFLVVSIILATPQAQILSSHQSMSAPLFFARYFEAKDTMTDIPHLIF